MVSTRRIGRFVIAFAMVMLTMAGSVAITHGVPAPERPYSLELIKPKGNTSFKVGENVPVTFTSRGPIIIGRITIRDEATGKEEDLKASLAMSEAAGPLTPRTWSALWSTAGRKPGTYRVTVVGLINTNTTEVGEVIMHAIFSVVQPSGPAKITFREPAGGRQIKAGETVNFAVKAAGVNKVEFFIKDLQTGAEKIRPSAHLSGSDDYTTTWSTEGLQRGSYQIVARGLGTDGKVTAESSVTVTITGGSPAFSSQPPKPAVAPNVVGMTEQEAVTALNKAGLKTSQTKYVSTSKQGYWGKVVEQSVKAGTMTTEPISITVGRK
jgi:PASTA domain/Bacterial Ig domain